MGFIETLLRQHERRRQAGVLSVAAEFARHEVKASPRCARSVVDEVVDGWGESWWSRTSPLTPHSSETVDHWTTWMSLQGVST